MGNPFPEGRYHELSEILRQLSSRAQPFEGTAYRSTTPRYATETDAVSGEGSSKYGGRWNPVGLVTIYASLSLETAMAETLAYARYYRLPVQSVMPRTFIALKVQVQRLLDLTQEQVREALPMTEDSLLRSDWRREMVRGEIAITQAIGRAAYDAGLEAILVPSAAQKGGQNLIAFPTAFLRGSHIDVLDADRL